MSDASLDIHDLADEQSIYVPLEDIEDFISALTLVYRMHRLEAKPVEEKQHV